MRSSAILRRSRLLFKTSAALHPALTASPRPIRPVRKDLSVRTNTRVSGSRLSSSTPSSTAAEATVPPTEPSGSAPEANDGAEPSVDESDKPRSRRSRVSPTSAKDAEPLELPDGLNILWSPEDGLPNCDIPHTTALPPPEIFEEALNNLHVTLHPQTQHRATYVSPLGPPTEPTLGFYCPIEGGEYVIDATVRELARRTGSEVIVLDAVQLAAGEWGQFGKAANSLQLPRNPLHFQSSSPPHTPAKSRPFAVEEDESDSSSQAFSPSQMTLTVMTPPAMQGRTIMTTSRRSPPPSKIKVFFDALVNIPSKQQDPPDMSSSTPRVKPRLVYIRDFPTLAPSSSAWYAPLLSAVRQRRRGPLSRPLSPISNPMTIIFGMSPSLTPPVPQSPSGPGSSLMSLLTSRNPPSSQVSPKAGKSEWAEDEVAEKAREKRLRDRLRKWEKGDPALYDEFPTLLDSEEGESDSRRPEIIVIGGGNGGGGGGGMPGFPPMLSAGIPRGSSNRPDELEPSSAFFRASVLVPSVRSLADERATRVARRREINELTMRMGVGAVGGILADESPLDEPEGQSEVKGDPIQSDQEQMWDDWAKRVEVWSNVRQIADRAVGSIMSASKPTSRSAKLTLEPTSVPWRAVHGAWVAHRSVRDLRKGWLKEASPLNRFAREHDEDEEVEQRETQEDVDEVVERIKNDSEIDSHEQRLLSCIVDAASMHTSFSQVHLPPHTIDSVRTIVSLPLLHPQAFQQGILKEHGMTGCLLFGPPGTGKTLVVRALAKEAGCRMMMISPSDVMDMYVGEGEKLVKAVFSLARKLSPCVVFLDEIDALFGARMSARESGGAFAHRGVITEFMQEMDGLKSSKEDSVIVIGATNRPFDLDDAVLRRLPRRLLVDLPGDKEREEILKILLRDETLGSDLDINALAKKTESFSGSDLKHLCVAAALDAVKENVHVPWATSSNVAAPLSDSSLVHETTGEDVSPTIFSFSADTPTSQPAPIVAPPTDDSNITPEVTSRVLHLRNFTKALKEITPSSSEALGSLAELRKWNEEFGEGRKDRKRQQVWGKGRFGFTDKTSRGGEDGRVLNNTLIDRPSLNPDTAGDASTQ